MVHRVNRPYFCDWISASQTFDFPVTQYVKGINHYIDGETGECTRETGHGKPLEGSYNTSLHIQALGHRVTVRGNVGRFGRLDNVFGYSVDQCKRLVNDHLARLDLPRFTDGDRVDSAGTKSTKPTRWYTGAKVSRLDLTENYETGSMSNAQDFKYWLRSQRIGKLETSYKQNTVYFGKDSTYKTIKVYLKGPEIKNHRHIKGRKPADVETQQNVVDILSGLPTHQLQTLTDDDVAYRHKLIEWCNDVGLVRVEAVLKQAFLFQHGISSWAMATDENIENIYIKATSEIMNRCHAYENIRDLKPAIQNTIHAYLRGENIRAIGWSDRTYRRYRNAILAVGIDIDEPLNVRALAIKPRVIQLRAATAPEFYKLPHVA